MLNGFARAAICWWLQQRIAVVNGWRCGKPLCLWRFALVRGICDEEHGCRSCRSLQCRLHVPRKSKCFPIWPLESSVCVRHCNIVVNLPGRPWPAPPGRSVDAVGGGKPHYPRPVHRWYNSEFILGPRLRIPLVSQSYTVSIFCSTLGYRPTNNFIDEKKTSLFYFENGKN